jgi:DNA mismatch repair protein MutL
MSTIRILPERVACQIAAGEVVERPGSIVRELLDNSIDAGADRILIQVKHGGKMLVRVTDNGCGMGKDDLLLCLERHATSKIGELKDLFSIKTLGFRGEALPSLCAVSRLEITSRETDQLVGHKLKAEGGKFRSIDETGAPVGTSVEVRDLFFNTPARRKFLRSDKTETDYILDAFLRIALPFFNVYFRLDDGERTLLTLSTSESMANRLVTLFGRDVVAGMVEAEVFDAGFRVKAYLGPAEFSRAKGDRIFIYVNQRNIKDRLLTHALLQGYGQRLMKGQYPQAIIFIELDPSLVDVNVHPMKQEVRFQQPHLIHEALKRVVDESLRKHSAPTFRTPSVEAGDARDTVKESTFRTEVAEPLQEYARVEPQESVSWKAEIPQENSRILGQLRNTYLVCQIQDGLLLVDQHAAHERIVYETLKKNVRDSKIERQAFLIPHKLELSLRESRSVLEKKEDLSRLGFEIDSFGGSTLLLRSVPSVMLNTGWEAFFREMVSFLEGGETLTHEKTMDKLLTVMACHGAIRAGQRLSQEEMNSLLSQLEEAELPTHCPHGRPVSRKFTYYEIEKMFRRVV